LIQEFTDVRDTVFIAQFVHLYAPGAETQESNLLPELSLTAPDAIAVPTSFSVETLLSKLAPNATYYIIAMVV
jgi:hypothetical protein